MNFMNDHCAAARDKTCSCNFLLLNGFYTLDQLFCMIFKIVFGLISCFDGFKLRNCTANVMFKTKMPLTFFLIDNLNSRSPEAVK